MAKPKYTDGLRRRLRRLDAAAGDDSLPMELRRAIFDFVVEGRERLREEEAKRDGKH